MILQIKVDSVHLEPFIELRRFSVEEYHALGQMGILDEDDNVELLNGLISLKMIHSPIHDGTVSILEELLREILPAEWKIRIQSAISLDTSEPEPDLAIVRGPVARYVAEHPCGNDLLLVIEVAESSLARDRYKASIYALASIPFYWIVNLADKKIEIYSEPNQGLYQKIEERSIGEKLSIPGVSAYIDIAKVLVG